MVHEKDQLIKRLNHFLQSLGIPVEQAYLFGSRTRKNFLKSSDVDLIIVSEAFAPQHFFERMSWVLRKWKDDEPLEPLCYTPSEFEKKKNQISIVREAVRTGVRVI